MNDEPEEIRLPESEPSDETPVPILPVRRDDEGGSGCLVVALKIIAILVLGVFVLAGLVLATCFLGAR